MSRRSSRLQTTTQPQATLALAESEDQLEDVPTSVSHSSTSPPKRRKTAHSDTEEDKTKQEKTDGLHGLLQDIKDAPLDVLFEILGHLDPLDILHLSRTSKDLRQLLMTKSSAFIWRDALASVDGLPGAPSDINEVQYTRLAFESFCSLCPGSNSSTHPLWEMRMRCCTKCLDDREGIFLDRRRVKTMMKSHSVPNEFLEKPWLYMPSYVRRTGRSTERYLFYLPHVQRLCDEYGNLKDKTTQSKSFFEKKEKERYDIFGKYAEVYRKWDGICDTRRAAVPTPRTRRQSAIMLRLTALGWGNELALMSRPTSRELCSHTLVNQPRELTDRIWSTIEPTLLEFLTAAREKRLKIERADALEDRYKLLKDAYRQYLASQAPGLISPPVADIALSAPFRALINDTPFSTIITPNHFTALASLLLAGLISDWRAAKDAELVAMLPPHIQLEDPNADLANAEANAGHLHLATTVFKCAPVHDVRRRSRHALTGDTADVLTYPGVLSHAGASSYDLPRERRNCVDGRDLPPPDAALAAFFCLRQTPWNYAGSIRRIMFSVEGAGSARAVVEAAGLDPGVATMEDMDSLNPLLECVTCAHPTEGRVFMRWKRAVRHGLDHDTPHSFTAQDYTEHDRARVLEIEETRRGEVDVIRLLNRRQFSDSPAYEGFCRHCRPERRFTDGDSAYWEVRDHFRFAHGIREVTSRDWRWGEGTHVELDLNLEPVRLAA